MSCVFVLTIGIIVGAVSWIWISVILKRLSRSSSFAATLPTRLDDWLPPRSFERRLCIISSAVCFTTIATSAAVNLFSQHDHRPLWLVPYFVLAGLLQLHLLALHGPGPRLNGRLLLLALPLSLLPLAVTPQSVVPLLDVFMTTTGFRSNGQELVLVDDEAEQLLQAQASVHATGPRECAVEIRDRQMWYLPDGVVIWQGPGENILISSGQAGGGIVFLRRDQVMIAGRQAIRIECPSLSMSP